MQVMETTMVKKTIGVNEKGLRVGESHQRAKLTNAEVDRMRKLHEEEGFGYRRLARMFEVGRTTVCQICRYEVRNQPVVAFRKVGKG